MSSSLLELRRMWLIPNLLFLLSNHPYLLCCSVLPLYSPLPSTIPHTKPQLRLISFTAPPTIISQPILCSSSLFPSPSIFRAKCSIIYSGDPANWTELEKLYCRNCNRELPPRFPLRRPKKSPHDRWLPKQRRGNGSRARSYKPKPLLSFSACGAVLLMDEFSAAPLAAAAVRGISSEGDLLIAFFT